MRKVPTFVLVGKGIEAFKESAFYFASVLNK